MPSHFVKSDGTHEPLRLSEEASRVTVAAYNILTSTEDGDDARLSVYEEDLHVAGTYRYWKNRRANVAQALRGCDVVGLCEVTEHMARDLLEALPQMRLAELALKSGEYDGSAVLFDPERFRVRQVVKKRLQSGQSQILLACLLQDVASDATFWFVMLHLKSDGGGAHGGKESVRVEQARRAQKIVRGFDPPAPVVIAGDLNSDRFLYPGFEEQGQTHVLNVFSDFASALPLKPTYHYYGRAAFDHILVRGMPVVSAHVPDSGGTCPNARQGSDHLPVRATLAML